MTNRKKATKITGKTTAKKEVKKDDKLVKGHTSKSKHERNFTFQLRFHTQFGQRILLLGNHPLLGSDDPANAIPLQYLNDEFWSVSLSFPDTPSVKHPVHYRYILLNEDGTCSYDRDQDRYFLPSALKTRHVHIIDQWNYAGFFENAYYTEPFKKVLLRSDKPATIIKQSGYTHSFHIKAPLLKEGETMCLLGSSVELGQWCTENALQMQRGEGHSYSLQLDLKDAAFPLAYKYAIWDEQLGCFFRFEEGDNRILHHATAGNKTIILHDGFARFSDRTWKGTGVAIPVFSLRSEKGLGIGEFSDIKQLAEWAARSGLRMIQLLPVNDTTATLTWKDSYPYAAISAFALHPVYLNLFPLCEKNKTLKQELEKERSRLNANTEVDYDAVLHLKLKALRQIYAQEGKRILSSEAFIRFFEQHVHWLQPYAMFCYLRDLYGTAHYTEWPQYARFQQEDMEELTQASSKAYADIAFHYFVQYHLHIQLKEATDYARSLGVVVKGDIAIGVYRYGADAWQHPHLFHMHLQAGAPPDDFAVAGQNWGFPTYHWEQMEAEGFSWWKQRFAQMAHYFDAFRIDHILGFFRIWSIPLHAVQGIMGHFVPAIPVHINEIQAKGISFDHHRFTQPFIQDDVLWEIFGHDQELVKSEFLQQEKDGTYTLLPAFNTQRKVEVHFAQLEQDEHHHQICQGLYQLISNVILFPATENGHEQFHFRFHMERTSSFRYLSGHVQERLKELYIDYFFRRQDDGWMREAMKKLPALTMATNMLVCGEDLGLVPACVPHAMAQLGILSLEIQRMPKNEGTIFSDPAHAPYLSVVTPSTHDMSTIREWWEEDRELIRTFYHKVMQQWGEPPAQGEAWIARAIVLQHLHAPAMWSVFQLQDLLAMDARLRRKEAEQERINIPANPQHYWRYRMHLTLEELIAQDGFSRQLAGYIKEAGR